MKTKQVIRSYNSIVWIQIRENWFVRKQDIESFTVLSQNNIILRTCSGMETHLTAKEAARVLKDLGFNESEVAP